MDDLNEKIKRVFADLGIRCAYNMPSFWANGGKDYIVIPTRYAKGYQKALEDAEREITEVLSEQPEHTETHSCDCERAETHNWIPVTERLPEDGVTVWVTIKGHDVIRCEDGETLEQAVARIGKMRRVSEGFWCEDDKTWYNEGGYPMMVQPVAWMPMEVPEPYKEGQDEVN